MSYDVEQYSRAIEIAKTSFEALVGWNLEDLVKKDRPGYEVESELQLAMYHYDLMISKAKERLEQNR